MRLRLAILVCCVALLAPAAASAAPAPEAEAVRQATAELWNSKRTAKAITLPRLAARERAAMAPCRSKGTGWKRIRKVRNRSQRNAYARAARVLWRDLSGLAGERAERVAFTPAINRYLARLDGLRLGDPALVRGVAAQRTRLAAQDQLLKIASCRTFESRLRRVRGFRTSASGTAEADAMVGAVVNFIGRYVANRRTAAESRYLGGLEAASRRLVELGTIQSDADGFLYALYLRN